MRKKCPRCHGWGSDVLTQCPLKCIDDDTYDVIQAADLAENGCWPVSGGWLEQSAGLLHAVRQVWQENRRYDPSK